MIIRAAMKRDYHVIIDLFRRYDFKLDLPHLERLIVAEEDGKVIAVMSLNTVLECSFLSVDDAPKKSKVESLKRLVAVGINETKSCGFDLVHAFANEKIAPILKKHFNFQPGKGENLVLFME